MRHQKTDPSLDPRGLSVETRGPGEWIVGAGDGRPLHVYRLASGDWLVSEVGRASEGRGVDLARALSALSAVGEPSGWWSTVAQALAIHANTSGN